MSTLNYLLPPTLFLELFVVGLFSGNCCRSFSGFITENDDVDVGVFVVVVGLGSN